MEEEKKDNSFSIKKASELLQSFVGLMKEGCVDQAVYEQRKKACEGCEFNQKRSSDNAHFCGSCGCGARDLAKLYVEGVSLEEDHSVRLWMPKAQCPKDFHIDEPGTKNYKPIGGRLKQLKNLTIATMAEAVGQSRADDKLEYINRTVEIVESVVEDDKEMNDLTEIFEESLAKEKKQSDDSYNKPEGGLNETTEEHSNKDSGFRGNENS